jgi:hypothetical protein
VNTIYRGPSFSLEALDISKILIKIGFVKDTVSVQNTAQALIVMCYYYISKISGA